MYKTVRKTIDGAQKQLVKESNKLLLNLSMMNSRKAARVLLTAVWGYPHFSCAPPTEPKSKFAVSLTTTGVSCSQNAQSEGRREEVFSRANLLISTRSPCGDILTSST